MTPKSKDAVPNAVISSKKPTLQREVVAEASSNSVSNAQSDSDSDVSFSRMKGLDDLESSDESDDDETPQKERAVVSPKSVPSQSPKYQKPIDHVQRQTPITSPHDSSPSAHEKHPDSSRKVGNLAKMFESKNIPLMRVATISDMEQIKREAQERSLAHPQSPDKIDTRANQSSLARTIAPPASPQRAPKADATSAISHHEPSFASVADRASMFEKSTRSSTPPSLPVQPINRATSQSQQNNRAAVQPKTNAVAKATSSTPVKQSARPSPRPATSDSRPSKQASVATTKPSQKKQTPQAVAQVAPPKPKATKAVTSDHGNYGEFLYSRGLSQIGRKEQMAESIKKEEIEKLTFKPQISEYAQKKAYRDPVEVRTLKFHQEKQQKLEQIAESIRIQEEKTLTFTPKINDYEISRRRATTITEEMQEDIEARRDHLLRLQKRFDELELESIQGAPNISEHARSLVRTEPIYARLIRWKNEIDHRREAALNEKFKQEAKRRESTVIQVEDRLYQEAKARKLKMKQIQATSQVQAEELRKASRVNPKSAELSSRRLLKDIQSVVDAIDVEGTGLINYTQLEDILAPCFAFSSASKEHVSSLTKELWDYLVSLDDNTEESNDSINSLNLLRFFNTVLGLHDDEKERKIEASKGTLGKLVKRFRSIQTNPHAYRLLNYLSKKNRDAIERIDKQMEECTFKPTINEKSLSILAAKEEELETGSRAERLYQQAVSMQEKQRALEQRKKELEMEECTFAPKISAHPRSLQSSIVQEDDQEEPEKVDPFERLHAASKTKARNLAAVKQLDTAEYTFRPNINKSLTPKQPIHKPKGFDEKVERMRKFKEEKALEEIEKQKRFETKKFSKQVKPFNLSTGQKVSKEPLMFIEVNLGPRRAGRIAIHDGDTPGELARKFASVYKISQDECVQLEEMLYSQMKPYISDFGIEGDLVLGATLLVAGTYVGGTEADSVCNWFRVSRDETTFAHIGEGVMYRLEQADLGCYIQVEYIPLRLGGIEGDVHLARTLSVITVGKPRVHHVVLTMIDPRDPMKGLVGSGYYECGVEGSSYFEWKRLKPTGELELIDGENERQYAPTQDDFGCRLIFGYMPINEDGDHGDIVYSEPSDVILPPFPFVEDFHVFGDAAEGGVLSGGGEFRNGTEGQCRWRWYRQVYGSEKMDLISEAHNHQYVPSDRDVGCILWCECTPIDDSGKVGQPVSAPSSIIEIATPRISEARLNGGPWYSDSWVATWQFAGGAKRNSAVYWYRSHDEVTWEPLKVTGPTFRGTADDIGCIIRAQIVPILSDGSSGEPFAVETGPLAMGPEVKTQLDEITSSGEAAFPVVQQLSDGGSLYGTLVLSADSVDLWHGNNAILRWSCSSNVKAMLDDEDDKKIYLMSPPATCILKAESRLQRDLIAISLRNWCGQPS
eukprot:TRINITY_DN6291_c0_g1_i2.p1 TRINITY_DN6291_c0_g1~~TRINITY_DN6291_c0_g1_i2.p1  ORF type:complete len:1526 (-),score=374.08 TRINITY_DN6291_c0_g1_i2:202-4449(-)